MKQIVLVVLCGLMPLLSACKKVDSVVSDNPLRNGGEYWEQLSSEGNPIGWQRNVWSKEEIEGSPITRFEQEIRMIVLRYGDHFDISMTLDVVSNPNGEFLSSHSVLRSGAEPISTQCRVENDRLIVSNLKNQSNLPWQTGTQGPDAVIRCLWNKPMVLHEERTLTAFDPVQLRGIETKLYAEKIEKTELPNGQNKNLLRISVQNTLKNRNENASTDQTFQGILWTDAAGNILRNEMSIGQTIVAQRVDRKTALAIADQKPEVELGRLGVVPLNRRIDHPQDIPRVSFIVRLKDGSPLNRFPNTPFQEVIPLDEHTAKITVWSSIGPIPTKIENPVFEKVRNEAQAEDLASGTLINLEDSKLKELAESVVSSLAPWQAALELEKLAHKTIEQTNFSVAFASSSETLQNRSGDCTEFAVLLAALCRSKGIPTRLTLGLVYSPLALSADAENRTFRTAEASMIFHLWNEVLVDGVWRPLDATQALGGANAARIKIYDSALNEDMPTLLVQSIFNLIGRLEINVQ